MRRKKGADANMKFLFGSVFFFFVIILVIGLFSYFTLEQYWHSTDEGKKVAEAAKPVYDYSVAFDAGFKEKSYRIYLNDSLLYAGRPVNVDNLVTARRFNGANSLLVVDDASDAIATIIELGRGGDVKLKYNNGAVSYHVKE